jgi:heme/copper-type cytochrome/quinol oxidase subunit 2
VIVAGSVGVGIFTLQGGVPESPCANVRSVVRSFTIIADLNGFNNSKIHQGTGPYLVVNHCDTVLITVVNSDTQAHGFVISYYAPRGIDVQSGTQQTFRFLANKTGQFTIQCNSTCSVHAFMLHGLLTVT